MRHALCRAFNTVLKQSTQAHLAVLTCTSCVLLPQLRCAVLHTDIATDCDSWTGEARHTVGSTAA
jgi:hypothetical protein